MLLSSAIEMIAFGEKSEKGAVHENSVRKPDLCVEEAGAEMAGEVRAADAMERQRRNKHAAKNRERIAILGGRMLVNDLRANSPVLDRPV